MTAFVLGFALVWCAVAIGFIASMVVREVKIRRAYRTLVREANKATKKSSNKEREI